MAEKRIIHAALGGPPGSNVTYFFRGDQYVVYDWGQNRVTLAMKSISDDWTPHGAWFAVGGPHMDAALSAHEVNQPAYASKLYFFKGSAYVRYDWNASKPRPVETAGDETAWRIPAEISGGVDAAVNGKYSRQGKSYFLKGNKYARYDWQQDRLDYVKTIDQMAPGQFPDDFKSDIDAIVNGEGAYADYAYFFKGADYIRFDWDNGGNTPFVDGGPSASSIRKLSAWPGVWEMLLACEAKSKAFEWVWAALPQLQTYVASVQAGVTPPTAGNVVTALQTHFRLDATEVANAALLQPILANLQAIERYLHRAPELILYADYAQCQADGNIEFQKDTSGNFLLDHNGNKIPQTDSEGNLVPNGAAYTSHGIRTRITPLYRDKGEACRAAQLIHEGGHFVDIGGDAPRDIPEWYVTQPAATALGLTFQPDIPGKVSRYDQMTKEVAQHNPSSYAAFCQQLRYNGHDTRYGEARQFPISAALY
jgi:hypothetical protein